MTLELTKTRIYGHQGGMCYRASVDGEGIAVAKLKADAESEAIQKLYSAYAVSHLAPAVRVLVSGEILVGTYINKDTCSLCTFQPDGKRNISSTVSNLQIDGKNATLEQVVAYYAGMSDGLKWDEAAKVAMLFS